MGKRNPNNYGCVTKLSGNRSRPWVVRVTVYDELGRGRQIPIAYAETQEKANILLGQYNDNPWNIEREKVTLADLYARWQEVKMPKLGASVQGNLRAAYKHCSKYYGVKYRSIRAYQMQECIDSCGRSYSTQAMIKNLWGHLDRFAFELDIIDKMYSQLTTAPPAPETKRTPFTREQIDTLWKLYENGDEWADTALIFLYTGFRLSELLGMRCTDVDTSEWYMQGGVKTAAGKGRIVPIHALIKPLVQARLARGGEYLFCISGNQMTQYEYYKVWGKLMEKIGADKTPHEARHTFETELDSAGGNRKCIDLLMGHKSKDVGNRVYNHKTITQLRDTVALLK